MITEISTYDELKKYFENNEFIYIIYSEYGCKIGISNNPIQRLEQIRRGLPSQEAIFIGLYKGTNSLMFEKKLHARLNNRNISGEWFILSQNTLDDIDTFLLSNEFLRIAKVSILLANYLIPSIYLLGHIKIIEIEKGLKQRKNKIEFPDSLENIIQIPTLYEIQNGSREFLTATDICNRLKIFDYYYSPSEIGQYLRKRGMKQKSRRIKNVGVRKVYEIYIKTNET